MKLFGVGWIAAAMVFYMTRVAIASPSGWAELEVKQAIEAGLVADSISGMYQKDITREEFAELAVSLYSNLSGEKPDFSGGSPFQDTSSEAVALASQLGIVQGVGGGLFNPEGTVTREQLATMVHRTLKALNPELDESGYSLDFKDSGEISSWARESVSFMAENGLVKGTDEKKFMPEATTTREQAIVIVFRTSISPDIEDMVLPEIRIESLSYERETYYRGEEFEVDVEILNRTDEEKELWLGCSFLDPNGKWIDMEAVSFKAPAGKVVQPSIPVVVGDWVTGEHGVRVALWDKNPALVEEDPAKLDQIDSKDSIWIYRYKDSFKTWNSDFWAKDAGTLGRTELNPENISVGSDGLMIKMPAGRLEGGEILTRKNQSFGSYEIRMKLANAPSSITGFFLYRAPDLYNEIDIEVFNQSDDAELWLTTYENGKVRNEYKEPLGFDPTAGYHDYRIDYYQDRVSFYIDGNHIETWKDGFSKRPMKLMLNSWYPNWLDGKTPKSDKYTYVEWIKY